MSDPRAKSWILNEVGLCLMNLGRLGEAAPFYERKTAMQLEMKDWRNASIGYRNLAELQAHLGALAASADAARQALALARRAENKEGEMLSLAYQAWAAHLLGDLEAAGAAFRQAEALERESDPDKRYLYSLRGIQHADHLRRAGDPSTSRRGEPAEPSGQAPAYARRVTEANLEILERLRGAFQISQCHRVLGDLDADPSAGRRGEPAEPSGQAPDHESARAHYDQALKIARSITHRPALIEALLARGRWAARHSDLTGFGNLSGLSDLNEALGYAVEGGYRVYEADVRVALAWVHLAALTPSAALRTGPGPSPRGRGENRAREGALRRAHQEAKRAQQMSVEMGYHWGQVDAAEALAAVDEHGF